ncbi:MAG: DUF2752 domain-containing protein [Flavobacteriaceae bacterium]|jgi:hypothetical protein|nr:DUF2752 domain-containing protein [Flavobacteriaceae bacterium]
MKNWFVRITILVLICGGLTYYYLFFGEDGQAGMTCVFNKTFGWQCPGCGGQRAVKALLHGDFRQAFVFNPMIYIFTPFILYLGIIVVEGYLIGNKRIVQLLQFPTYFGYWFLAIIILFTIVRNIWSF